MRNNLIKSPRLYVDQTLCEGNTLDLSSDHAHYLLSVMRKQGSETIRIFNGKDGEFSGDLHPINKKSAQVTNLQKIKDQPPSARSLRLYFAAIKKDRMHILIEKAVELGVTDLHPIVTDHTENRKPNLDKARKHIIEAAEQCERLTLPTLHPLKSLHDINFSTLTYAAMERANASIFNHHNGDCAMMIGPEGGWSKEERDYLTAHAAIKAVSLGDTILRAETAAIAMLARCA